MSPEKGQIVENLLVIERSWALTSGERNVHSRERNIPDKGTYILESRIFSREQNILKRGVTGLALYFNRITLA